jgi:hypothetical protein
MKMNKYLMVIGIMFLSVSCLEWGLDELPLHSEAEILNFRFEYRYAVVNDNGFERLAYVTLNNNFTINENQVTNVLSIPEPSGTFTPEIMSQVGLNNIIGYCDISNAATIEPFEGAPVLGTIADFSQPVKYKVTAADGTVKIWTIVTNITP